MVRLLLGFVGRSSTWNLLRELTFPDHVGLRYVGNEDECHGLDLLLVEDYMVNTVRCSRKYVLSERSIDGVVEAIVKGLGLNELNVGIDMGNSRCGLVILMGDTPIIHVTLGFTKLVRLLRRLAKYSTINLVVGTSPGISELLRDLLEMLSDLSIRVKVIDEEDVNDKKAWFKGKYSHLLMDDELDALVYVYEGLATEFTSTAKPT